MVSESTKGSKKVRGRIKRPPASSLEAREKQLIALAVDNAEEQMINGTASSAVITHYLKLASTREQLEKKKMEMEIALLQSKKESLDSSKHVEELYSKALEAFTSYKPHSEDDGEDFDE